MIRGEILQGDEIGAVGPCIEMGVGRQIVAASRRISGNRSPVPGVGDAVIVDEEERYLGLRLGLQFQRLGRDPRVGSLIRRRRAAANDKRGGKAQQHSSPNRSPDHTRLPPIGLDNLASPPEQPPWTARNYFASTSDACSTQSPFEGAGPAASMMTCTRPAASAAISTVCRSASIVTRAPTPSRRTATPAGN